MSQSVAPYFEPRATRYPLPLYIIRTHHAHPLPPLRGEKKLRYAIFLHALVSKISLAENWLTSNKAIYHPLKKSKDQIGKVFNRVSNYCSLIIIKAFSYNIIYIYFFLFCFFFRSWQKMSSHLAKNVKISVFQLSFFFFLLYIIVGKKCQDSAKSFKISHKKNSHEGYSVYSSCKPSSLPRCL